MPPTTVSLVEWVFRNVTQGFNFWPRLDSIGITDSHPIEQSQFTCEVEDPELTLSFDFDDILRVTHDDGSGAVKVHEGPLQVRDFKDHGRSGPRIWSLQATDYTPMLAWDVITTGATRRAESAADRLDWLMTFHTHGITVASATLPGTEVESADYLGQTVLDAVEQLCQDLSLSYYVDFDQGLHIFTTEVVTAPFAIVAEGASPPDSYPFWDWHHEGDVTEQTTKLLVIGDKRRVMVTDAAALAEYGSKEGSIDDSSVKSEAALTRAGNRALLNDSQPVINAEATIAVYGLRSGMTLEVEHHLWPTIEDHSPYIVTSIATSAVDPNDANDLAQLRTVVSYSDRRRHKAKGRNHGGGDHDEGEDGTSLSLVVREAHAQYDPFELDPIVDTGYGNPVTKAVGSAVWHNLPYTTTGCPLGVGGWSGVSLYEGYYEVDTSGLSPDLSIGIRVTVPQANPSFVFGIHPGYVYGVHPSGPPSAPDYVEQYLPLGTLNWIDGDATFLVPRAFVNYGGTTYVAIAPDWRCMGWDDSSGNPFFCAQDLADGTHGPAGATTSGGEGYSGMADIAAGTAVNRVISEGRGLTPWVSGEGDVDGTNREFLLIGWDGSGVPYVKVNGLVYSAGDFTVDEDAGTVTLNTAPEEGDVVMFRYKAST